MKNTKQIPYFEDRVNKFIPNQPIVKRNVINAVVYNPITDEVLCMKWNNLDWQLYLWEKALNSGLLKRTE